MAEYHFNISLQTFDASLLPSGSPAKGSKDYAAAVHHFLQEQFAGFKGDARIVVSEDSILVEWTPPPSVKDPIEAAVMKLESGEMIPAIVMLELLRQEHPDDLRLLYNLGLAYSNFGRLEDARATLNESIRLHPSHVNSRVALGVTYAKEGRNQEAVKILEEAVAAEPNNPWAQRNLGGCLLALREVDRAISCLLRATQLNPKDQQAFFGLGEAYRVAERLEDADTAYRQVVAIDEFNDMAKRAKQQLSALARVGFMMKGGTTGRPDAVMYCLSALEHFADSVRRRGAEDYVRDWYARHEGVRGQRSRPTVSASVDARQVQRAANGVHHVRGLQANRPGMCCQLRSLERVRRGTGNV